MGFMLEKYSNYQVNLIVSFQGNEATLDYTPTNNVDEAIKYFGITIENNKLYVKDGAARELEYLRKVNKEQKNQLQSLESQVQSQSSTINGLTSLVSDEIAAGNKDLFPTLQPNETVGVDEKYNYDNTLYRVAQSHITDTVLAPETQPKLYTAITSPDTEDI